MIVTSKVKGRVEGRQPAWGREVDAEARRVFHSGAEVCFGDDRGRGWAERLDQRACSPARLAAFVALRNEIGQVIKVDVLTVSEALNIALHFGQPAPQRRTVQKGDQCLGQSARSPRKRARRQTCVWQTG